MSLNTNTQPNGTASVDQETIISTEIEIMEVEAEITALMAENLNLLGGEDVSELLERLTSADTVAQGMESKLDSLLENLDDFLSVLGSPVDELDSVEAANNDTAQNFEKEKIPLPGTISETPT